MLEKTTMVEWGDPSKDNENKNLTSGDVAVQSQACSLDAVWLELGKGMWHELLLMEEGDEDSRLGIGRGSMCLAEVPSRLMVGDEVIDLEMLVEEVRERWLEGVFRERLCLSLAWRDVEELSGDSLPDVLGQDGRAIDLLEEKYQQEYEEFGLGRLRVVEG